MGNTNKEDRAFPLCQHPGRSIVGDPAHAVGDSAELFRPLRRSYRSKIVPVLFRNEGERIRMLKCRQFTRPCPIEG
eukprot:scaffold1034_cov418-Prasinococcus_capsulatus_cf.AAC.14